MVSSTCSAPRAPVPRVCERGGDSAADAPFGRRGIVSLSGEPGATRPLVLAQPHGSTASLRRCRRCWCRHTTPRRLPGSRRWSHLKSDQLAVGGRRSWRDLGPPRMPALGADGRDSNPTLVHPLTVFESGARSVRRRLPEPFYVPSSSCGTSCGTASIKGPQSGEPRRIAPHSRGYSGCSGAGLCICRTLRPNLTPVVGARLQALRPVRGLAFERGW